MKINRSEWVKTPKRVWFYFPLEDTVWSDVVVNQRGYMPDTIHFKDLPLRKDLIVQNVYSAFAESLNRTDGHYYFNLYDHFGTVETFFKTPLHLIQGATHNCVAISCYIGLTEKGFLNGLWDMRTKELSIMHQVVKSWINEIKNRNNTGYDESSIKRSFVDNLTRYNCVESKWDRIFAQLPKFVPESCNKKRSNSFNNI